MADEVLAHSLRLTTRGVHLFMLAREIQVDPWSLFWRRPSGNRNGRTSGDEMRELREDLERLDDGWVPSADDLADVPRLESWGIVYVEGEPLWRLSGALHDAARDLPDVVAGENVCTMQVLAVDEGFTLARDRRGFYLLGEPA